MEKLSLGTTGFNDAARCMKRYEYRWELGLVPPPRDVRPTLRRGVWLHRMLQLHDLGEPWQTELGSMGQWAVDQGVDPEKIEQAMTEVEHLVEDYIAFWSTREEAPGPWETVETEYKVCWSPRPELDLTARWICSSVIAGAGCGSGSARAPRRSPTATGARSIRRPCCSTSSAASRASRWRASSSITSARGLATCCASSRMARCTRATTRSARGLAT